MACHDKDEQENHPLWGWKYNTREHPGDVLIEASRRCQHQTRETIRATNLHPANADQTTRATSADQTTRAASADQTANANGR